MIKPTVGRRLWFWPGDTAGRYNTLSHDQPFDAGVLYVHSDTEVNLLVTDHTGFTFRAENTQLVQEGEERPTGPHATWMPFQQGQARVQRDAGPVGQSAEPNG